MTKSKKVSTVLTDLKIKTTNSNNVGWECPNCHTIWSPSVQKCNCLQNIPPKSQKNPLDDNHNSVTYPNPYRPQEFPIGTIYINGQPINQKDGFTITSESNIRAFTPPTTHTVQ